MMRRVVAVVALAGSLVLSAWNCSGLNPDIVVDCSLDGSDFGPCPNLVQEPGQPRGTTTFDGLEPGVHEVTIRARQLCGRSEPGVPIFGPEGTASYVWDHDPAEEAKITFEVTPGRC